MVVRPAQGEVLRETKTTTIEPAEEQRAGGRKHPPMWEWIETLTAEQWNTKEYEFIVYRGSKFDRGAYCCKYYELIDAERIKKDFGGGKYNILMKVPPGKQLRYNEDLEIAGSPKEDAQIAAPAANDAMGQIIVMFREELRSLREELKAARGGDFAVKAAKQATTLSGEVFKSSLVAAQSTLSSIANGGAGHATNPMNDPMRMMEFLAQVKTLFAPSSTNSLQETLATLKLFKESGLMGPAGGGGEKLTDKLVMGLVNSLPTLTQHFSSIMDGYSRAEQAKATAAAIARGVAPPITVQPIQQPAPQPQPPNVITMPAPQQEPAPTAADGQPTADQVAQAENMMRYIETKIVEILSNQALTPEEAAAQALTFIDVTDPVSQHPNGRNLIDEIVQHGKAGLDWVFNSRTILQEIPKDERLEAFKKAFLDGARPVAVPENLKPNPNTPPA